MKETTKTKPLTRSKETEDEIVNVDFTPNSAYGISGLFSPYKSLSDVVVMWERIGHSARVRFLVGDNFLD